MMVINKISYCCGKNDIELTQFGAIPNDELDDTQYVEKALLYCQSRKINSLKISGGVYNISSIFIDEGIKIYSNDNSSFKRLANQDKWSRMFTTYINGKYMSKNLTIQFEGLRFDGNYLEQGNFSNHELEHQAIIFISGDISKKSQIKVSVKNCRFSNSAGDGIHLHQNVNASIEYCNFKNLFRGAVTMTGGNSDILLKNLKVERGEIISGIDVEYDSPGDNNDQSIRIVAKNLNVDGDFDIGLMEGCFKGDNIICLSPPLNFFASNAKISINNSKFYGGEIEDCRIIYPHNVSFNKCNFYLSPNLENDNVVGNFVVLFNSSDKTMYGGLLKFENCNFYCDEISTNKYKKYAIRTYSDVAERNNRLIITKCKFYNYSIGVLGATGGSFFLSKNYFDCEEAYRLDSQINSLENYNLSVEVSNNKFSSNGKRKFINKHKNNKIKESE